MQNETDMEPTILENCTIWAVTTSGWSGTDPLTPEDIGKHQSEIPEIVKLGNKHLLPYQERTKLNYPRTTLKAALRKLGRPFPIHGAVVIDDARLPLAKERYDMALQEQDDAIDDFLSRYDAIRSEQCLRFPILKDAQWPEPKKIRKAFKIKVMVFQIANTVINEADPEDVMSIKEQLAEEYKESLEELKEAYIKEAQISIIQNCNEIAEKIQGKATKVTATTLKKPMKLIEEYEAIAEKFDAAEIKAKVAELKQIVSSATAHDIRASDIVAENFAHAVKSIAIDMEDLSGYGDSGQIKRAVNMGAA